MKVQRGSSAIYEIMWKNNVQLDRPQTTVWCKCTARWIPKATNTHSEYVILIAFAWQQWSQKHASMLPYTYTACPVKFHHRQTYGIFSKK